MRVLTRQFGRFRLLALIFAFLPFFVLPIFGMVWLWQESHLAWWMLATLIAVAGGWVINWQVLAQKKRALDDVTTTPGGNWSIEGQQCWTKIEDLAKSAKPTQWPLSDVPGMLQLAQEILETVARHFHPRGATPLLQMTVPHTLAVIERAAKELRQAITDNIPASHWVTLGQLSQAKRWAEIYRKNENWIRVVLAIISPQSTVARELRGLLLSQVTVYGSAQVQNWLLQEYIRKIGYHAIELYGGFQRVDNKTPLEAEDPTLTPDSTEAARRDQLRTEPMRICVFGRANSGKSSLINALFGELLAATDLLPDTTDQIIPYQLDREGERRALIFDTPGFDGKTEITKALDIAATHADFILWVTSATRPDRAEEKSRLDHLREVLNRPDRRPPPLLIVLTHIDQLRPLREWTPPYELEPPEGEKAKQIAAAIQSVARDLDVEVSRVIPVCLGEDRTYNVDDMLWAEMIATQPEADRVRLLRCMRVRQRDESWSLLRRQLVKSGRVIRALPGSLR